MGRGLFDARQGEVRRKQAGQGQDEEGWMYDFHGVATKCLPNYLGWSRMMDNKQAYVSGQTLIAAMLQYKKRPVR